MWYPTFGNFEEIKTFLENCTLAASKHPGTSKQSESGRSRGFSRDLVESGIWGAAVRCNNPLKAKTAI